MFINIVTVYMLCYVGQINALIIIIAIIAIIRIIIIIINVNAGQTWCNVQYKCNIMKIKKFG